MKSSEIRQTFIDFFAQKGHAAVQAAPVVPHNDPTILFTNAGMNQFKDVFLNVGQRDYTRAVNSQPCIRVSGKHNDLEDVGADHTHLTLFEMLGNWSFGDYYKPEAIRWAWELFVDVFHLPADRLYATVYRTDDESETIWKTQTGIHHDHVLRFDEKDNFWEMGDTGPCGPCSELHLDLGPQACNRPDTPHRCAVNGDCSRYVELWNLVFIQYNRIDATTLDELPRKHVDTGAGLERLTAFLQGTHSAYATDLLSPMITCIESLSGVPYHDDHRGMPHRVLADHSRTLAFAIADNVRPSNEGRGYVLRRLLRRACRYAKQLGINEPILYRLVPTVIDTVGHHYTHIAQREAFITSMIRAEEESFFRTLEAGITIFESIADRSTPISGDDAFKLYDTYGFPLDLTELMARERGLSVDTQRFDTLLTEQRAKSRRAVKLHYSAESDVPMGGEARIVTDPAEKLAMARHHTATHLLQAALRQVLGDHVTQAGSLVDTDRLRFDFTHFKPVSDAELAAVLRVIESQISADNDVTESFKPIEQAKADGAMALFGEKYDDIVRVIQIGQFSMELCGGTHVSRTSEIETFKLISESGIAAGTRRIEAIVGHDNISHWESIQEDRAQAAAQAKQRVWEGLCSDAQRLGVSVTVPTHQSERDWVTAIKGLEKLIAERQGQIAGEQSSDLVNRCMLLGGIPVIREIVSGQSIPTLKAMSDSLCNLRPDALVVLGSSLEGLGHWVVKTGPHYAFELTAPQVVTILTEVSGGKGGGRPTMAQAGGADPHAMSHAVQALDDTLRQRS